MKGLLVAAKQQVTFCGFNKCLKSHLQKKKRSNMGNLLIFGYSKQLFRSLRAVEKDS